MLLHFLFAAVASSRLSYSWKAQVGCILHVLSWISMFLSRTCTQLWHLLCSYAVLAVMTKLVSEVPVLALLATILNISVTWFTAWPQN